MSKEIFILTNKQIDDLYNKAEEIYSNISMIKSFCRDYYEVDEFFKIKSILKYTYNVSDELYAKIIDIKYGASE